MLLIGTNYYVQTVRYVKKYILFQEWIQYLPMLYYTCITLSRPVKAF